MQNIDPLRNILDLPGGISDWDFFAFVPRGLVFDDEPLEFILYGEGAAKTPTPPTVAPSAGSENRPSAESAVKHLVNLLDLLSDLERCAVLTRLWEVEREKGNDAGCYIVGVILAIQHEAGGRHASAQPFWRALEGIERRSCKTEELSELFSNALGAAVWTYWSEGRWHPAEYRFSGAVQVLKRIAGSEILVLESSDLHQEAQSATASIAAAPSMLCEIETPLARLADAQRKQSDLASLQVLFVRAVNLCVLENTAGPSHLCTATCLNLLLRILHDADLFEDVVPLARHALFIREQTLGTEHLHVAESLNNLAAALVGLNALDEAEPLVDRATKIAPAYSPPWRWLARINQRRGNRGQEIAAWRRFLELGTSIPEREAEARNRLAALGA